MESKPAFQPYPELKHLGNCGNETAAGTNEKKLAKLTTSTARKS